ncbi:MAG: OprD family outer membrane porin [Thermoanaerobaculia bacterium]
MFRAARGPLVALVLAAAALTSSPGRAEDPPSAKDLAEFFGGGRLDLRIRGYLLDRTFVETFQFPETKNEALALGGGLAYRTAAWHGASVGLTFYTSQKIWAPADSGGSGLLQDGESFSVLGEAFLQWEGGRTKVRLFRQRLDTPVLGSRDIRMVPYTWQAYTVENGSLPGLTVLASWVTHAKDWTSTAFVPIGTWIGAPEIEAPTGLLGLVWENGGKTLAVQGWGYDTEDVVATAYLQADGRVPVGGGLTLALSGQWMSQREVGAAVYPGVQSHIGGLRAALSWKKSEVRLAGTASSRDGDFLNLFGTYPGFTSIMEEDNNLAGERSWLLGLTLDLSALGVPGLDFIFDRTKAWVADPRPGMSPLDQKELDVELRYRLPKPVEGLLLRLRYANVRAALDQGSIYGRDFDDFRVVVQYDLPLATVLRR